MPQSIPTDCLSSRWLAVRVAANCERRVAAELSALGYAGYCPMGARHISWKNGIFLKNKIVREFPVFARYIFVGLGGRETLSPRDADKIEYVLGDSRGPLAVPGEAIREIAALETAGFWDATRVDPREALRVGDAVRLTAGALAGALGVVDRLGSEERIRVLISMFGRKSFTIVPSGQIAKV